MEFRELGNLPQRRVIGKESWQVCRNRRAGMARGVRVEEARAEVEWKKSKNIANAETICRVRCKDHLQKREEASQNHINPY